MKMKNRLHRTVGTMTESFGFRHCQSKIFDYYYSAYGNTEDGYPFCCSYFGPIDDGQVFSSSLSWSQGNRFTQKDE